MPEIPTSVERTLAQFDLPSEDTKKEKFTPSYRQIGDSKIAVSKATGTMWKSRKDAAQKAMSDIFTAWDEAISYYLSSADTNRSGENNGGIVAGSRWARRRINEVLTERENIVYANVSAIVPTLYAKAPEVTVDCYTSTDPQYKAFAETCENLVNALIRRKSAPGVNLKPKVKKGIVATCLTNEAWLEVGYTEKDESGEQVVKEIQSLSDQYEKAKTPKQLQELEGKLRALESKVDVLMPSGPFVKLHRGHQVLIDPETGDDDCMDAQWIMVYDYLPTNFLNAQFGEKDANGLVKSVYQPTHILSGDNTKDVNSQINNFRLFTEIDGNKVTDRREEQMFKSDEYTKVWKVYDKTSRRIMLFSDKDWSWPIWVWEDTYKLDRFFPLYRLQFHTQPDSVRGKGEVSYYLDQVDGLNEINDAEARARQWVKRNVIYDTNTFKDANEAQKYFKGDSDAALGVAVPEGRKLEELFGTPVPDVVKFRQLFDDNARNSRLQAVDRVSSTNDVLRGSQFKTNTTNKAIDTYNSVQNTRLDERIDAIEDWIGDVAWGLMQLCVPRMSAEQVAELIGPIAAQSWQQMPVEDFRKQFYCEVTGGSTVKPTSKAKKEEAMELGQVLGQFVNAAPGPTLKMILRVMERAFDEVVMTDADWEELDQAIFAAQQQGNSTGAPTGGEGQPPDAQGGGGIEQILAQLPPEAQQAVQMSIQQGVPPEQAVQEVMKALQQ